MALVSILYLGIFRPVLFLLPPELAHRVGILILKGWSPFAKVWKKYFQVADPRGHVVLGTGPNALHFKNAVGLAAGFDKDGVALPALAALGFGFIEVGTVTPRPQPGNPAPRLFRFPNQKALVNRMGFNNAGVEALARRLSRCLPLDIPVGINIGKNKDTPLERAGDDYLFCLDRLFVYGDFFVVNVSSPNTPGLRALQSVEHLEPLLTSLRRRAEALAVEIKGGKRPLLFVKVSPDESEYSAIVETVIRSGFDGIAATNTTRERAGLPANAPPDGGVSGAPLTVASTEVLRRMASVARGRLLFIGVGGIFQAEEAFEKVLAGASLVELYTGFVYGGPTTPKSVARRLPRLTARSGFGTVQGAVGKAL